MLIIEGRSGMDHTSVCVQKNPIVLGKVVDHVLPLPKKYPDILFLIPSKSKHTLVDIGMCLDDCM